ncbi:PadR family transcriptional regulator [bacterium]|nr:PadR family transcriptional regulator [bacterium]
MKLLSRSEEIILLTILKLGDEAYGVSIRQQIEQDTGSKWSFASIYSPLDKLTQKKFTSKEAGESTASRGGKRKFYYQVTHVGKEALREIRKATDQVWSDLPDTAL